jgi:hypothetical protein
LGQAHLTPEFFIGGLPEKKVYLGVMSILYRWAFSVGIPFCSHSRAVKAGLTGAQGLELTPEGDVVQLLLLLEQPLQLFHLPLPLVNLVFTYSKVLLLLGGGAGPSLGRCIQLLCIRKGSPGVGVMLGDVLHLQVETMLSGLHRRPLKHCHPHEHACP